MLQPAKLATPLVGVSGFALVQVSAAAVGFEGRVMLSVIGLVSPTTVLPPASCTATDGCVPRAVPPVDVPGSTVKPSFIAGPTAMVNAALVPVSPASVVNNV